MISNRITKWYIELWRQTLNFIVITLLKQFMREIQKQCITNMYKIVGNLQMFFLLRFISIFVQLMHGFASKQSYKRAFSKFSLRTKYLK